MGCASSAWTAWIRIIRMDPHHPHGSASACPSLNSRYHHDNDDHDWSWWSWRSFLEETAAQLAAVTRARWPTWTLRRWNYIFFYHKQVNKRDRSKDWFLILKEYTELPASIFCAEICTISAQNPQCLHKSLHQNQTKKARTHCSHVGPHLRTLVPMGTNISFGLGCWSIWPSHFTKEWLNGFCASWESSICERKLHYPGNRTQDLLLTGEIWQPL